MEVQVRILVRDNIFGIVMTPTTLVIINIGSWFCLIQKYIYIYIYIYQTVSTMLGCFGQYLIIMYGISTYAHIIKYLMHLLLSIHNTTPDQTGWPYEQSIRLSIWEIGESKPCKFKPRSSQTNDFKIDACHFQAGAWHCQGKAKAGWLSVRIM